MPMTKNKTDKETETVAVTKVQDDKKKESKFKVGDKVLTNAEVNGVYPDTLAEVEEVQLYGAAYLIKFLQGPKHGDKARVLEATLKPVA